jgi:DNA-binding NtrC family response regulator
MAPAKNNLAVKGERAAWSSCQGVPEGQGYDADVTSGILKEIEGFAQAKFDSVIVDLRMRGTKRAAVVRIIKLNKPEPRVFIILAGVSVAAAMEAIRRGTDGTQGKSSAARHLTRRFAPHFETVERPCRQALRRAQFLVPRITGPEVEDSAPEIIHRARILLASSNAHEIAALRECLSSRNWRIEAVTEHEEVIRRIRSGDADVLITGIDVLGMKAYDLIPKVKKLRNDIPIIVASADPSLESARKIREFGIFFYLMEPFDPEEVRAAAHDAVAKAMRARRPVCDLL